MSGLKPVLARLADGATLNAAEAAEAFACVMRGEASAAQAAALLSMLRVRGETVDEIAGAATAMRGAMLAVEAIHNRPNNAPAATGASHAAALGKIVPGRGRTDE